MHLCVELVLFCGFVGMMSGSQVKISRIVNKKKYWRHLWEKVGKQFFFYLFDLLIPNMLSAKLVNYQ